MHTNIKYLPFEPRIYFTIDDWDAITEEGKLTKGGMLEHDTFIALIRKLYQEYVRKRLAAEIRQGAGGNETLMMGLKLLSDRFETSTSSAHFQKGDNNIHPRIESARFQEGNNNIHPRIDVELLSMPHSPSQIMLQVPTVYLCRGT